LQEKYKSIVISLIDLIIKIELDNNILWVNLFTKTVLDIIANYENNFKLRLIDEYGKRIANEIYKIVYEGLGNQQNENLQGFKTMHATSLTFLKSWIQLQDKSNFKPITKLTTFFVLCNSAYELAFSQIENRLTTINGVLTKTLEKI